MNLGLIIILITTSVILLSSLYHITNKREMFIESETRTNRFNIKPKISVPKPKISVPKPKIYVPKLNPLVRKKEYSIANNSLDIDDLNVKNIHSFKNKYITANNNLDIDELNANAVHLKDVSVFSKNPNGNILIGDEHINNIDFSNRVNLNKASKLSSVCAFNENVIFNNGVYFNDNLNLENGEICFTNSNNDSECFNNKVIEKMEGIDIKDLESILNLYTSACISTKSLQNNKPTDTEGENYFNNTYPLSDDITCMNESTGVDRLNKWFMSKDIVGKFLQE